MLRNLLLLLNLQRHLYGFVAVGYSLYLSRVKYAFNVDAKWESRGHI